MANEVDILIRIKGDAEKRIESLQAKLNAGGPVAQRFGRIAGDALGALKAHGASASTAIGGIGSAAAFAGGRLNTILGAAIGRLTSLTKWAALAGAAFAGWQIRGGLKFNAELEQTHVALSVLYRSSARANEEMRRLVDFAAKTPFEFPEVAETSRQLTAFGLDAREWLGTVGDLAAGVKRPIAEVATSFGYLASGRTGEAIQSLARMGVNLRAIQGLKFDKGGSLTTAMPEAMQTIKAFLDQRFGGMMERQSTTFSGALSTLLDNVAIARGKATETLFAGLRDRLVRLNDQWDRIMDGPRAARVMGVLQRGLESALSFLDRLVDRFNTAFDRRGSIGDGLKAVWGEIWPHAERGAKSFIAWFARALGEGLKLAWDGFWQSSGKTKLAVGAAAGLMLAPAAMNLLAALPELMQFGGAAWNLGKGAIGGIGNMIGKAPQLMPYAVETATGAFSRVVPGTGSGMLGAMGASGAGLAKLVSAAAVPVAIAVAAGLVGRYAIGVGSEIHTRRAERNVTWGSRENQIYRGMVDERRDTMTDKMESSLGKLRALLNDGAAKWAELLAIQERIAGAVARTVESIGEMGDAFLEKFRTPEEKSAARLGQLGEGIDLGRLDDDALGKSALGRQELARRKIAEVRSQESAGQLAPDKAAAEESKWREYALKAVEEEARLRYEILGIEEERLQKIREQNKAFGESLSTMKSADRERLAGLMQYVGKAEGTELASKLQALGEEDRRLLAVAPGMKEKMGGAMLAQFQGLNLPGMEPAPDMEATKRRAEQITAETQQKARDLAMPEPELARRQAQVQQEMILKAEGELKVKLTADDIKLVVSADPGNQANEAIQAVLERNRAEMVKQIEDHLRKMASYFHAQARDQYSREAAQAAGLYAMGESEVPR